SSHIALSAYSTNLNIITDAHDNFYIMGEFSDTLTLAGTTLIAQGSADIFLIKYNPYSTFQWAKQFGGSSYDSNGDLKADHLGNVYISGTFSTSAEIGDYTINSEAGSDYIAQIMGDGSVEIGRAHV